MAGKANPIPKGYNTVTAYICMKGAAKAIEFYKRAFGAQEVYRIGMPGSDQIAHAEIQIGDTRIMLADEMETPDMLGKSPQSLGGTTFGFMIYTEDCDKAFRRAMDAGARERRPLQDQFYGDRSGTVEDPFGHCWTLATHVEDVSPEELKERMGAIPTR